MLFPYELSHVFGAVYTRGNVVYSPDDRFLFCASGNRVVVIDLTQQMSTVLPLELPRNVYRLAISPCGTLLLAVDEYGFAFLISLPKRLVLCHINFKDKVRDAQFSPCGSFIAV